MRPIHLFLYEERENKEAGSTFLFYNTRATTVCLGVYDQNSEIYKLENGDSATNYELMFGVCRIIGVVLVEEGV